MLITGATRREKQLRILCEFAAHHGITIDDRGNFLRIEWPKFRNFLPPASRQPGQRHADADSDADADTDSDAVKNSYEGEEKRQRSTNAKKIDNSGPPPLAVEVIRELWPPPGRFSGP
jgi:hypothetical protein